MAIKMVLPVLGQTMEEGTITKWLKNEGDQVAKGEPILEVMTDKVNMEVEAPESGVLRKILAKDGDVLPVMGPIAIIGTVDESIDDLLSGGNGSEKSVIQMPTVAASAPIISTEQPAKAGDRIFISPRARKLAEEAGISIEMLAGRGTGPEGRIVEKDVTAYIASKPVSTPLAARIAADQGIDLRTVSGTGTFGKITREDVLFAGQPKITAGIIPFTGMRKMVADNVAKSAQTAPHVTLTLGVDMTEAVNLRAQVVQHMERKYGVKMTFTDLIVKAVAVALLDHPILNATLQVSEIRIQDEVNIGIAVALDGGLIVPVLKNADRKSVPQISGELKTLVEKARSGGLSSAEISGGTFSITNLGALGVEIFNPIITPGQSAILGVCRIAEQPAIVNGQLAIRSMMNLCLSFDHRVMDGAPAARFLKAVKDLLESPYQLLI